MRTKRTSWASKFVAIFVTVVMVTSLVPVSYASGQTATVTSQPTVAAESTLSSSTLSSSTQSGGTETVAITQDVGQTSLDAQSDLTAMGVNPFLTTYTQQTNSTVVTVTIPNYDNLIVLGATSVVVEVTMSYDGVTTRDVQFKKSLSSLSGGDHSFTVDFTTYGKFTVDTKYYNGTSIMSYSQETKGITAAEYNIAPLGSTFPVTLFSLSLWDITKNSSGNVVPTITLLERPTAYNWDCLPNGVYSLPYITEDEAANAGSWMFKQKYAAVMDAYVRDLYELSPDSKFNFYFDDFFVGLIQSEIYANKIPSSQYTIKLLSDGGFSASSFQRTYTTANASDVQTSLISSWNTAKDYAYETGTVADGFSQYFCADYVYAAVASETNIEWWIGRKALLTSGTKDNSGAILTGDGDAFGAIARSNPKVVQKSIATMLTSLQAKGPDTVAAFKALYNFNDGYFSEAAKQGKKVMLLLGAWDGRSMPIEITDYARFAETYYGSDYLYYYKGHPATPMELYPAFATGLDEIGVTPIDASIAAEIVLFFNPDIYLSGFASTTWQSVSGDMAATLFGMTKAVAAASTTNTSADTNAFISLAVSYPDATVQALCTAGNTCYVVEFANDILATVDYTIAIWDATSNTLSYYKLDGTTYSLVRTVAWPGSGGGQGEDKGPIEDGVYTISCKGTESSMVEVDNSSTDEGANVQIYTDNSTSGERFRLIYKGDGYYNIQNVNSGKMLDVEWAGMTMGTNVWQYTDNGCDSEKWLLVDTGDGDNSYYLVSKLNGLYLDRSYNSSSDGTNIMVWAGNGLNNQKFYFNDTETVKSGTYSMHSGLDEDKVVDIQWNSTDDGGNVWLYSDYGFDNQKFVFAYDSNTGYYGIQSVSSGKMLDVQWGDSASGTNVWQYSANGLPAQQWSIKAREDGAYIISSATGGCCLDVTNAQTDDGTNIQAWTRNEYPSQQWILEEILPL